MKIVAAEILVGEGLLKSNKEIRRYFDEIQIAVSYVRWPADGDDFAIRPVVDGNGVVPIKIGFLARLRDIGWQLEVRPKLLTGLAPGKIDAVRQLSDGTLFAAEWETGNISSSHRALNKMAAGILSGKLSGGVLVLPDRELYRFLTQRIGNFPEIAPYFPLYRTFKIGKGFLAVLAVSHHRVSPHVALIPKGMDGNSLARRLLEEKPKVWVLKEDAGE